MDRNIEKSIEKNIDDIEKDDLEYFFKVFRSNQFKEHFEYSNEKDMALGLMLGIVFIDYAKTFQSLNKIMKEEDLEDFWSRIFNHKKDIKKKIDKAS